MIEIILGSPRARGQEGHAFFVSGLLQSNAIVEGLLGFCRTTLRAVPADLEACNHNVEMAIALDLSLEPVEKVALEFGDLAAAQTSHVDVVALGPAFIKVFFALHVHKVEFIDQAVTLQQAEGAIDRHPIDTGIEFARPAQDLAGIEMLLRSLDHTEDGTALMSHAQAA